MREVADVLKTSPEKAVERLERLVKERRQLERELQNARRELATNGGGGSKPKSKDLGGISLIRKTLEGMPARELKNLVDGMKGELSSGVVAVISNTDGKASLVVGVTSDLTELINAVDLVRVGAMILGGKGGGGRPDMAQAGGPDGSSANAALDAIESAISKTI